MAFLLSLTAVRFNPAIGVAAFRGAARQLPGLGGAWRAWILARSIDVEIRGGSGVISREVIRDCLVGSGVRTRTADLWLRSAVSCGLFTEETSKKDGTLLYRIASEGRGAVVCGCARLSSHPVQVSVGILTDLKRWRAFVFAGWRSQFDGPVSQYNIQQMTGLSPRTQRRYLNISGVERTENRARYPATRIDKAGAYELNDIAVTEGNRRCYYRDQNGRLSQRLPDTVSSPAEVRFSNPGRRHKAQRVINGLKTRDRFEREGEAWVKVFCVTDRKLKQTTRRQTTLSHRARPEHYFLKGCLRQNVRNWRVMAPDRYLG